jgi:hypothetical protein
MRSRVGRIVAVGVLLILGVSVHTQVFEIAPASLPAMGAHTKVPEWVVPRGSDTTKIIGTTTRFGGSDAVLPDRLTPDPFASLGSGRCVNRGWVPRGHPLAGGG